MLRLKAFWSPKICLDKSTIAKARSARSRILSNEFLDCAHKNYREQIAGELFAYTPFFNYYIHILIFSN